MDIDDQQPFVLWMGRTWDVSSDDVLTIAFLGIHPRQIYVIQDGGKDRRYLACFEEPLEKLGVEAGNGEKTCDKAQLMNDEL